MIEHEGTRFFSAPAFQPTLDRPKETIGVISRLLCLEPFQQLPSGAPGFFLEPGFQLVGNLDQRIWSATPPFLRRFRCRRRVRLR